jgi:hypothetical protein
VEHGGSGVSGAEVTIHGFPFLTQLARGSLARVTATLDSGSFGGYAVSDVRVAARDVDPRSPWHAGHATADGVVAFDTVGAAVGEQLGTRVTVGPAPADPGAVTLAMPVTALGTSVDVVAVVLPDVVDGALAVQVTAVSLGGVTVDVSALPAGLADRLGALRVPLRMPDGVTLVAARGEPGGVRLVLDARDVALGSLAR